jgi:hypothetical protein
MEGTKIGMPLLIAVLIVLTTRVLFTENHDMASNQNKGRIPSQVNPGGSPYVPNYCMRLAKLMYFIGSDS